MRDEPERRGLDCAILLDTFLLFGMLQAGEGVQGEGAAFEPPCPAPAL